MDSIEITSLSGNRYIYDSKNNLIVASDHYSPAEYDQLAGSIQSALPCQGKECFSAGAQHNYMQLCLVLTDRCNFRCKYCINSDAYENSKGYAKKDMSKVVINKALDYYFTLYTRSRRANPNLKFSIGFYGGEPLLRMDSIRYIINRVENTLHIKNPIYTVTTNGYLLNQKTAKYLSDHGVHVSVSVDGYKEYHDKNRVTEGQKPTFDKVCDNVRQALKVESKGRFSIIITYDTTMDLFKANDFYKSNPELDARITNINPIASQNKKEKVPKNDIFKQQFDVLYAEYLDEPKPKTRFLTRFFDCLFVTTKKKITFGNTLCSTCSPLKSKLTVSTNGNLHICEKINERYSIGNVYDGLNYTKCEQYYNSILRIKEKKCAFCPIRHLCNICFVVAQGNGDGFSVSDEFCANTVEDTKVMLKYYCSMLDR